MASKLDYLQKYLSKGDENKISKDLLKKSSKKKKKNKDKDKEKVKSGNMRIIDDMDFTSSNGGGKDSKKKKKEEDSEDDEDRFATQEEQPVIAGFVDDRPEIVIMREKFKQGSFQPVIKIEDDSDEENESSKSKKKENSDPLLDKARSYLGTEIKEEPLDQDEAEVPRRRRHHSGSDDNSPPPPRRRRHDSGSEDGSPPRRRARHDSSDASPPRAAVARKRHDSEDNSPPRRKRHDSEDNSPPRRRTRHDSSDASPPRIKPDPDEVKQEPNDSDASPPRRRANDDSDASPPRIKPDPDVKIEKDSDGDVSPPRRGGDKGLAKTTLDGKRAGLQKAKDLKNELADVKRREREMFDKLDNDVSGRGAETKVRGRLKDKQEEERKKKEANEINDAVKDKYKSWSKGVRQGEMIKEKIKEDLAEMDKPLARTAEDADEYLRSIERAEDPMLQFIRKKKEKAAPSLYPKYQGHFAPNRFGIAPGYRWDGVDRGSGFEKKLFQRQNRAKANVEDAYKWSTEDM